MITLLHRNTQGLEREYLRSLAGSGDTVADTSPLGVSARLGGSAGADGKDPAWATDGLDFDGSDDYLDGGSAAALSTAASTNPWTFVCVFKRDASGAAHQLFQARNTAANNQGVDAFVTSGNVVQLRATATDGTAETHNSTAQVAHDIWHFVSVAKAGTIARVMVNGERPTFGNFAKAWASVTGNLDIGAFGTWANTNRFNGKITYAALYGRYLSTTRLQVLRHTLRRELLRRSIVLA